MDLNEVKKLVNGRGEKVILMENGNPTIVLLSYEEYKRMNGDENIGDDLAVEPSESAENTHESTGNALTLEDLPF